jgi:uncharacterized coiled-coil protein SlyX
MRNVPTLDERIAELEARQDGRREAVRKVEELIARRQLVIDNLKAQRDNVASDDPDPPTRAVLKAL